ncbi:hypothetical protein KAR91_50390 [Candidatus Pacearchaeota archaeon]|nr:hypothetical protein [Candidatus Pacearchaeota archaeon]
MHKIKRLHGTEAINYARKPGAAVELHCLASMMHDTLDGVVGINEALLICLFKKPHLVYCDINSTMPFTATHFVNS